MTFASAKNSVHFAQSAPYLPPKPPTPNPRLGHSMQPLANANPFHGRRKVDERLFPRQVVNTFPPLTFGERYNLWNVSQFSGGVKQIFKRTSSLTSRVRQIGDKCTDWQGKAHRLSETWMFFFSPLSGSLPSHSAVDLFAIDFRHCANVIGEEEGRARFDFYHFSFRNCIFYIRIHRTILHMV